MDRIDRLAVMVVMVVMAVMAVMASSENRADWALRVGIVRETSAGREMSPGGPENRPAVDDEELTF
ncbi:MAG: hypothetical protein OSA40_08740 [Phycisphaerales bacterium]|nr:hypothetical protein [Phycisphaerales bacterium]